MRIYLLFTLLIAGISPVTARGGSSPALVDPTATPETVALFHNLRRLAERHVLFGHHNATAYGHGWSGDIDRSDVKSVVGSHPVVIGEDLAGLSGAAPEAIAAARAALRQRMVDTYDRGGLSTVSWHMVNPVTPQTGYAWKPDESAPAVRALIPGGTHHEAYQEILRTIAALAHDLRGANGTLAPVIFRPFHEFDGDWFWWGRAHCTREEFIALWHFTVTYLRDELQVRNFLYAFSPDVKFRTEAEFLERYPGDAWVDLVGFDDYADFGRDGRYNLEGAMQRLRIVSDYAVKAGKISALTETGLESIPHPTWWTEVLLKALKNEGLRISYVLLWRNDAQSPTHYYVPFPGHPSAADFVRFYEDPFTLFESDHPRLYELE